MYKATLNNKVEQKIEKTGKNRFKIKGKEYTIERFEESGLITIKNGRLEHKVRIHKVDSHNKTFQFRINGVKHTVQIKDRFDLLLDELGFNSRDTAALNQIKAPMPGLIIEVNIQPGDKVNKGDKVLVLEAMKMENVIKSPGEGIVSEVIVAKGDSVEKNQVLIKF
jgi:biotin carboxyl carrier protein